MKSSNDLHASLRAIDHKGYPHTNPWPEVISLKTSFSVLIMYREILSHHLPVFISRCFITMLSFQKNIM